MGAYQRRKGHNGEREIAGILADRLGVPVRRTLGQSRGGSAAAGADIRLGRWGLEIKRRKRLTTLVGWMEQAAPKNAPQADLGAFPAVLMREDGGEWMVLCRLDDWLRLAREELVEQTGVKTGTTGDANENCSQPDRLA